jgi:hypothetical protein
MGAVGEDNCTKCSPGRYSALLNASSASACTPCAPFEKSYAGAVACWPGVVSVKASNPAPIIPMISAGDLLVIVFSRSTNAPNVGTASDLFGFLSFSSPIGSQLQASWSLDATTLTIRVGSVALDDGSLVNVQSTRIGSLYVRFNASAGLKDSSKQSQTAVLPDAVVTGDWGIPTTPEFIQSDAHVGAYARDTGQNAGPGVGDSLVLRFNTPCMQVDVSTKAAIDALFEFSSAFGTDYMGAWETQGIFARSAVTITVTSVDVVVAPSGAESDTDRRLSTVDLSGSAVGSLRVTVRLSAGMRSLDESTLPSNSTILVVHGTWGDLPSLYVIPRSHQSVRVLLFPPVTRVAWTVTQYLVQWSRTTDFSAIDGAVVTAAAQDETGVVVVNGMSAVQGVFLRASAYASIRYNSEVLADGFGPFHEVTSAVFAQPPILTAVSVLGANSMAASGGQQVSLKGYFLGLTETPQYVWASYSNGNYTHTAAFCHVTADNDEVQCSTVAGVGHSYMWTIFVDGAAASAPASTSMRYNVPVVLDVTYANAGVVGAGADGYLIDGRDFGPLGTVANGAWLTLPSDPRATFYSSTCVVTVSDVELFCDRPDGAGGEPLRCIC